MNHRQQLDRRRFLQLTGAAVAGAYALDGIPLRGASARAAEPLFEQMPRLAFPEKRDLIMRADRPPNLEMPLKYLSEDLTPNEVFYVRWHLGILPTRIDLAEYRLSVGGHVEKPLSLTLDELKKDFEKVDVVAVNQCSGNSRSFFEPRMPGVQWGNGAIGNAKWTGVRLKDVLAKAGVKAGAIEVSFGGMDGPTLPAAQNFAGTPDFVKSLQLDHANDGEVMLAHSMNDKPLPMLNGFPLRLIVPGWYATYWVKALDEVKVLDKKLENFWMAKAYRVPSTPGHVEDPKNLSKETQPISAMTVRSLFAKPEIGEKVVADKEYEVNGVALDGGKGIKTVEVSTDGGRSWSEAKLDAEIGKYSWRRWRFAWTPKAGKHKLMVKATNDAGEMQRTSMWNKSGYERNVIESLEVNVA
jgi:DMSO/TMAO reductase YedYZ molybdopterin-dependent catalytic subunit